MSEEVLRQLQGCVEDYQQRAQQRELLSGAEFYPNWESVYFGYPNRVQGRPATRDGRPVDFEPVLIGNPGPVFARDLAEALNSVLKSCREHEAGRAKERALHLQKQIGQFVEELANEDVAEINEAAAEAKTDVHSCPMCELPEIESVSITVPRDSASLNTHLGLDATSNLGVQADCKPDAAE